MAVLAARAGDDGGLARADRMAFDRVQARRSQAGIVVARAVSAVAEPGVVYPVLGMTGVLVAPDRLAEGLHAVHGGGQRRGREADGLPA